MAKIRFSKFIGVFDVFFIMLLCFITLLATMLIQGGVIVGESAPGFQYDFNIGYFGLIMMVMVVYIVFVIKNSNKELKLTIEAIYNND